VQRFLKFKKEKRGSWHITVEFSTKAEKNYCVTRRELLAVVESLKIFYHYLYGRRFQIRIDHISLRWLISFRDLNLQHYNFEIKHQAGKVHKNADVLSRRPCAERSCNYCRKVEEHEEISKKKLIERISFLRIESIDWKKAQLEDPSILEIYLGKEIGGRPLRQELIQRDSDTKNY